MSGLISHEHRYIFMHVTKTGGTTLSSVLPYDVEIGHRPMGWIKKHYPEEWKRYFKFAVVRNPYTRLISLYNWELKNWDDPDNEKIFQAPMAYNYYKDMSFPYFCMECLNFAKMNFKHGHPQFSWFGWDLNNIYEFDYIARFEKYENEIKSILKLLDIEIEIPHKLKTVDTDLSDAEKIEKYYKYIEQIKCVNHLYDLDFQNFNYVKITPVIKF